MKSRHTFHVGTITDFPAIRSTECAVCELCGAIITTTNGGWHSGLAFVPFERLLDLHMAERHANVCVLPASGERREAA